MPHVPHPPSMPWSLWQPGGQVITAEIIRSTLHILPQSIMLANPMQYLQTHLQIQICQRVCINTLIPLICWPHQKPVCILRINHIFPNSRKVPQLRRISSHSWKHSQTSFTIEIWHQIENSFVVNFSLNARFTGLTDWKLLEKIFSEKI